MSEKHRVLPFVADALQKHSESLPERVRSAVNAASREAIQSAFWWTAELAGMLQAFAQASIPVIPLKGPVMAQRVYGQSALRPCRDLDLLVRRPDFDRAAALIRQLGFAAASLPETYDQAFTRGSTKVELHFNVEDPLEFDLDVDSLWARSRPAEFKGIPIRLLDPTDEFHYVCLHGVRHRYQQLGYVLDVWLAERVLSRELPSAQAHLPGEIQSVVDLGSAIARRLMDCSDPGTSAGANQLAIQRLADKLWSELLEEVQPPAGWMAQHRFYRELERSRFRRMFRFARQNRILATRLITADFLFAERFGVRRPILVWLLRPFRLLSKFLRIRQGKLPSDI